MTTIMARVAMGVATAVHRHNITVANTVASSKAGSLAINTMGMKPATNLSNNVSNGPSD